MRLFITLGILLLSQWIHAQSTGLRFSDEKYQTLPLLPVYSGQKYNEVPLKVNLKALCPVAADQAQMGSCVGWAVGYGALTIMRAQAMGWSDPSQITQQAHSAAFIYNQIRVDPADCNAGAYIEDALKLLRDQGDCLEQSFNYQQADCRAAPPAALAQEAAQYKIQDYAAVFALAEQPKAKIGKICKILATQTPVVVGIGITPDFWTIQPGTQLWDAPDGIEPNSFHAMVVIGYDNVEKQFELLNSFGPGWGRNGFIKVKYDDFERLCKYAYVLAPPLQGSGTNVNTSPTPNSLHATSLSGAFAFRRPRGFLQTQDGQEIPYFEEVNTRWNPTQQLYETTPTAFPVGEVFQLIAREIPRGRFVYVFSQSPGESVNLHFPKNLGSVASANFVLERTAEIIIPSEETVLQLPLPGDDYLCILYAQAPIADLGQRLQLLEAKPGTFAQRLKQAFGDVLVPQEQVRYQVEKMAFQAQVKPNHSEVAVPLLLRVRAE